MITLTDAELRAIKADAVRLGVFFRMDWTPDPVRLWFGNGLITVGANAYDAAGATYRGFGELNGLDELQMLINGAFERITFSVSGVSATTSILASTEAPLVKGQTAAIGFNLFDVAWRQLGVPKWVWRGRADVANLRIDAAPEGGLLRELSLSLGSLCTGRRRGGLSYLTDADQQLRSPGDRVCERTALYGEFEKVWPTFA